MNCRRGILVVEDDEDVRETLRDLLELEGYEVVTAGNGAEALEMLDGAGRYPCLILLDLMMPVMDGWQFLQQFRSTPREPDIPVTVLSAASELEDVRRLYRCKAIQKPADLEAIIAAAREHCA